MPNILEINNLCKNYDTFSINNLSLKIPYGSIVGFIGENGSGKSTTIKLLLNIIQKSSGEIKIFGEDHATLSKENRERIGTVLDESCFPENLTLIDIEKIMLQIYTNWDKAVYKKYIEKFSLPQKKKIKAYSKGMKMKLSLAVALSHNSTLLILDEATAGLDPIIRDEILDVFLEFIQDEKHTIFISSHILSDLEKICDYIALLHKGSLVFCENKDILYDTYGILKCSEKELQSIHASAIIGYRKHSFGVEALVIKDKISTSLTVDKASIEEIMLYYIKRGEII